MKTKAVIMTNDSLAVKWDDLMSYRKTKTPERDDFVFYKVEGTAPNRQLIIRASPFGVSGGGVLWLVRGEPG
jgi:hypothetical protein